MESLCEFNINQLARSLARPSSFFAARAELEPEESGASSFVPVPLAAPTAQAARHFGSLSLD